MSTMSYKGDLFKKIPDNQPGYYNWVGKNSHYLTVVDAYMRITEGKPRQRYFLCKCRCGNEKLVHGDGIRKQRIKSCGCWKSVVDSRKAKEMGDSNFKHGLSRSRIYKIWDAMLYRCFNENDRSYDNYGGRGITVCKEWLSFDKFYEDMKDGYTDDMTIERIDVNGNYEKNNCKWITMLDQQNNKRNTVYIEFDGKNMTINEWAKLIGVSRGAIYQRLKAGKPIEKVLQEYDLD